METKTAPSQVQHRRRYPWLARMLVIVVPLHLFGFVIVYLGLARLVEREVLVSHSDAAEVLARSVVEDLHLVMVGRRSTSIRDGLVEFSEAHSQLSLQLFDAAGRLVSVLMDGTRPAGRHQIVWNGVGRNGSPANPGVYFYRLEAGSHTSARRLTVVN